MAQKQNEWSVVLMLEWATEYLTKKGVPNARFSIEWLLSDVLGMKRLDLYLYYDRPLSADELTILRPLVKRRAKHEPLQYITGHVDFLNTCLHVNADVLIPRPETELLVEIILKNHPEENLSVLDIGTGSGCIAIALKKARPHWRVTAIDISPDALSVAKNNAIKNNTDIQFVEYDILTHSKKDLAGDYDIIVSNPPYVLHEEKEGLETQVKDYEPHTALFCDDIENMYQQIRQFSAMHLLPKGTLYLEVHSGQNDKIMPLFKEYWQAVLIEDYSGKKRFVRAVKN